jgi:asparagine synthase (glutamine-hydrolysing)
MSAIAGILRFDGRPADRRDVERMMNALQAHGPDRRGVHAAGPVVVGHLLMRMTAEDSFEAQPLRGASGAVMVADLRLDNRDELIAALGLNRERALDAADSAIVLAAWEKWGNDAFSRLRGPFAIVVWDSRNRRLTLARDPLGSRPLYHHQAADFFAFATMPKGLFALPDVPRELNKEYFADFIIVNHTDCESSFYNKLFKVLPGDILIVDANSGKQTKKRFWGAENIKPVRLKSDQDYADALRERLDIAVHRHLRTIHKVGCFLSGGLDSSSVAALAAAALARHGKRLPAYTQVPDETLKRPVGLRFYFDERPYVEAIGAMIENLDITYVVSSETDDFADLDRIFLATDVPSRSVTNFGWIMQILHLARAENQRVLLGGELGNGTISWEGWEQAFDNLASGRIWTALRQWRLFYELSARSPLGAFRQLFLEPSPLSTSRIVRWARNPYHSAISANFAREMHIVERAQRDSRAPGAKRGSFALSHRLDMIGRIPIIGEWQAGMLAMHGIELRDPTADLDVVEFCLGIPDEQYLAEGIDRSLVRRAMWGVLPAAVLTNRRRGNQAADWFLKLSRNRQKLADEVAGLRSSKLAAEAIDLDRLEALTSKWPEVATYKHRQTSDYQLALTGGISAGRFLRLFERSN